jgi:hypothetical protein
MPKDGRRGMIVVLGEDENDRQSIRTLICGMRADISRGEVKALREPMALVKNLPPDKLPPKAKRVAAVLRATNARSPIRCVLLHEDADDVEPAHESAITKIESCYASLPWPVYAVVPAWEMEAWWFLFPSAVAALHKTWRAPTDYAKKNVGRIRNAKEKLKDAVRPKGVRLATFKTYCESDSPKIAEKVVALGLLSPPWFAHSASWLTFVEKVSQI